MREEFLEGLPAVQKKATLLMGRVPVACFVNEATMCEFRVAVPGIEQYEGDPRLTLVTTTGVFPVRIIRQEAHTGGYSFRLQRLDLLEQAVPPKVPPAMRTTFLASPVRATCVLAIIMASCVILPIVSDELRLSYMQGRRSQSVGWGSSGSKNDSVPAMAPPGDSLAAADPTSPYDSDIAEAPTVAISMISTARRIRSIPTLPQTDVSHRMNQDRSTGNKATTAAQRAALLKSNLVAGQSGGIQNLSRQVVPWLFGSKQADRLQQIRISDAAIRDLQQFETGLRGLPSEESTDVIASLYRVLMTASHDIRQGKRVAGLSEYVVMSSEDANLYFRIVQGRTELVRVLPIDFSRAE